MARVLVVEDDAPIATMIAEDLRSRGYDVDLAADGQQALERVAAERPNAIVLDLMMPVVSGWDFVEQYRARTGGDLIPIVVVSAAGAVSKTMEALGVRYFLPKPFEINQLAEYVAEVAST